MTGVGMMELKSFLLKLKAHIDKAVDLRKRFSQAAKKLTVSQLKGLLLLMQTATLPFYWIELWNWLAKNDKVPALVATVVKAIAQAKPATMEEALAVKVMTRQSKN